MSNLPPAFEPSSFSIVLRHLPLTAASPPRREFSAPLLLRFHSRLPSSHHGECFAKLCFDELGFTSFPQKPAFFLALVTGWTGACPCRGDDALPSLAWRKGREDHAGASLVGTAAPAPTEEVVEPRA